MSRVLMIAPTPYFSDRGCHVQIYEQIKALTGRGHEIVLCTYGLGRDKGDEIPTVKIIRSWGLPWYHKLEAGPSWWKILLDLFLLFVCFRETRRFKPDILHAHLHEGAMIGWPIARGFRIPLLFDYQGSLSGEIVAHGFVKKTRPLYRLFSFIENLINQMADVVVTQSSDMMRAILLDGKVKQVKLTLDGVNTDDFKPATPAEAESLLALKHQLSIPPEKTVIVYLGLLNAYQGVDDLLETIPKVIAKCPNAFFLIMGYPNTELYRSKADALGVTHQVRFTGRIDYALACTYLNLGSIAVGPKHGDNEGDGKIYNYMACGLAIVASDTHTHRELLEETASYYPDGNAQALAETLMALLENPNQVQALGKAARARVVAQLSWDAVAQRLEAAYATATRQRL